VKTYLGIASATLIFLFCTIAYGVQKSTPKEVHFVAEKAEDLIDFLLNRQWTKAESAVNSIVPNEKKVEDEILKDRLPLSTADEFSYLIFRLREMVKERKQPVQAALVANQITNLLIDLERAYPQTIPIDIGRIDYLGREIVLLSQTLHGSDLLNKRVIQLEDVWSRLKPTIEKKKGGKIILQMDQAIASLKRESSPLKIKNNCNRILDLVDNMEALFK
jgi:mannose/fructose/N-acetylgalactosamine-specific phosphotransferase system component IIB